METVKHELDGQNRKKKKKKDRNWKHLIRAVSRYRYGGRGEPTEGSTAMHTKPVTQYSSDVSVDGGRCYLISHLVPTYS